LDGISRDANTELRAALGHMPDTKGVFANPASVTMFMRSILFSLAISDMPYPRSFS
jgi:hypothetical protein